jgi:hypothetical protein
MVKLENTKNTSKCQPAVTIFRNSHGNSDGELNKAVCYLLWGTVGVRNVDCRGRTADISSIVVMTHRYGDDVDDSVAILTVWPY